MVALRAVLNLIVAAAPLAGCAREPASATPAATQAGGREPGATAPAPARPAATERPEPLVTLEFQGMPAASAVEVIAAVSGRSIQIAPECAGSVTLSVHDRPWREALDSVAGQCSARVVELPGGRWRVEPVR